METPGSRAVPIRTCLGCMKQDRKEAMVRVSVDRGIVQPDFAAAKPGRGGYLHKGDECLERFLKSKAREFKSVRMKIDRDQRRAIVEAIKQRLDRNPALE